jgi:hypothetical protein
MAAVAQQYYEDAAQNEQMGEDEGVSTISLSFWRSRMIKITIVLFKPRDVACAATLNDFCCSSFWGVDGSDR